MKTIKTLEDKRRIVIEKGGRAEARTRKGEQSGRALALIYYKKRMASRFFTVKPCAQVSLFKNYSDQVFLPECELAFFVKIHLNSIGKLYISLEYLL